MTTLAVQQIRTALACLHDPAGLEAHPLAGRVGGARGLRRALEDAIAGLRPHDPRVGVRAARRHDLLRLRYLEALPVDDVLGQ